MVVTKTRKKVTKVTKHKVTNNKTKKRHKNKQRGGAPKQRPQSAPANNRRKSDPNISITSAKTNDPPSSQKPTSSSRTKSAQNTQKPLVSRDDVAVRYGDYSNQKPRPLSARKKQQIPQTPIDNTINVPAFKNKYYNAISTVNLELIQPHIKGGPTIPDIINNMLTPGQSGGTQYIDNITASLTYPDGIKPTSAAGIKPTSADGIEPSIKSKLLSSQKFDEPNPAEHKIPMNYDVVIVGCTPEALYMSILLKILIPTLSIVVLECGENAQASNANKKAAADGPDSSSEQVQAARTQDNLRALTDETMMALSYIWSVEQMNPTFVSILNGIMYPPSSGSSTKGYTLLESIYYNHAALNVLNIFPSCFYTKVDNREHASIFSPIKYDTAKIQVNILEFFLTRRAIELNVVILHNVSIDELPYYVGANTCAIFNATGFFDMFNQTFDEPVNKYSCNFGVPYKLKEGDNFNKVSNNTFKLINKYGYYIATSKDIAKIIQMVDKKKEFKPCSDRNNTVNPNPLQKYHDSVPIISIGQSLRGKIIFEWHYLGFADCFIYGLLFKRIYDATAPVVPPVAALTPVAEPPPVVQVPPTPPPVAVSLDASLPPPPPSTAALTPPPPPPAQMQNNKSDIENVTRVNEDTIKQQSKVESDNIVNARLSNIRNMFEDARDANARKEALEQETARQKAVSEEAARLKAVEEAARLAAIAEAQEAARQKAVAEAEEAARLKAVAEAEEAARLKAVAEAEEAARLKALAEAEEAARVKAVAEAEEAARLAAVAEAEEAARVQAIAEAEEAARLKAVAEANEAARVQAAKEAEEAARLKAVADAEEAARVKAQADEAARVQAAKEAEEAARLKAVAEANEAAQVKAQAEEAARLKAQADEAARLQAVAEAARLKAVADAEEAARLKAEAARETTNDINLEIRDPPTHKQLNSTPIKTFEIMLGTNAPTEDGDTLDISIEDGENEGDREKDAATLDLVSTGDPTQDELAKYHHELDLSGLHGDNGEIRQGDTVVTNADPPSRKKVNATPIKTLEIALGRDAPTQDGDTLDISIEDVADDTQVMNEKIVNALKPVIPQKRTLEIALGTDAPTEDGDTLDITIEDVADENDEKDDEKNNEKIINALETAMPQKRTLEIVLGTDAPTQDGETLDITIEDANDDANEVEGRFQGSSSNYLRSIVDGAGRMVSPAIDFVSNAVSGVSSAAGRGIVAAAKGAADTAANCTSDRAADATRNALEYQMPTKDPAELRKEQDMDAKLDELKHQITDNVADAGELFVDNAKKMANSVASSLNPFNKNLTPNIPQNLLMSQNLNPPVKYLNISINPGIEFNPKMLNKNTSSADVHFNPLIKYSDRIINDIPTGKPNTGIYEKFFNNNSFNIMLANTLRGLFGQTLKTIDEATDAGIVDDNIVSTLNTLFATGNVIYINNSPYTIYTYSWNGEWYIDSKIPRNLDYITGLSSSSYRDPEQMQKYRDRQNAAIQKELKEKGIGEKYRMSSIRRERLIEDAKQRMALEKERDAKTAAKKIEEDEANKKLADKMKIRADRANRPLLELKQNFIQNASKFVPELKKEVMKAALNAIMSHKQFIRATMDERDIEIDPLSMSLFFPTDDLLDGMLEKTTLSQDYAVITEMHKGLIKIIEEYDAAEMEMYDTKTKIDDMYGKLKLKGNNKRKEEIINGLLKGKNLPYAIATDNLVESTFAHVDKLLDALSKNNLPVTQSAMQSGGLNLFKSRSNKVSPDTGKIKTRDEVIDSVNVDLDQTISKKDAGPLIEIVKYLGKQIVTTFYNDISELLTTVTQFKDTLANMIELTTTQYASQLKYYEQYITFLSKVENVSKKEKGNELFLMFIAHDKRTYREFNEILDPQLFRMDDMQIPETIDATNYFKDNSLMDIDSAHFNTYIAQILEKRYAASNKLWEISFKRALDAHTTINTYIKEFNDAYERDKQFLTRDDGNSQESSYAEYKQQRDALQAAQDAPNSSTPQFTPAFSTALFQDKNPKFKEIYDMYDSREGKAARFKSMFINVALAEITTLRKITFLTQSIHADDIVIYKCTLNDFLFKQHAANCGQNPAVKSAFFNEPCDQSKLNGLLKTNDDAKNVAVQQKQDLTGELTLLSDNQNNMFAELFPIDNNAKLEKMCNQALTGVSTLFEVTPFNTFMNKNGWSNDCAMQEINAPVVKAFKLSMLNEMFTHASKPISKKVSPSVYKNTNYWDLFCPAPADQSGDFKLLDAVSMLLNAEMHLTSSTIEHKYAPGGTFDLNNVTRIIDLLNAQQNEDNKLAILYQIFKIKFTIIEITYKQSLDEITSEQSLDIELSIAGCTNKLTARSQSDGQDAAYIPEEDVKQIEQEEKRTTFAFIIKYQGNYYIPYNSKIGTLLCSTKHLKSVGLDILLWSKCWNASEPKKREGTPPSWINMYKAVDKSPKQQGGADPEGPQQNASIADETDPTNKTIEEITEQNTNINAGLPLKSALKKSVKIADEVSKPAASADTVNYYDQLHINQTYSRDSKLSYYVAIDLVMVPGTSISLAQKAKLKCQMKSDNIRKSLSQIFGTIYVPTPIFITTSEEYAKSKTEEERNRIIQYQTVTDLVNEKKMNNLKGVEFMNAMREAIPRSNRMKNAFTHLRIASGEYNSILKNHDITIEELNSLITDANYQRNFMGGRSKKAARATTRLRKTRKRSRRF
jgi:hypothetical protein